MFVSTFRAKRSYVADQLCMQHVRASANFANFKRTAAFNERLRKLPGPYRATSPHSPPSPSLSAEKKAGRTGWSTPRTRSQMPEMPSSFRIHPCPSSVERFELGDTEVDTKHIQRKILSSVGIIFLFREGEFSSSSSSGTVGLVEARTMTKVHGLRVCYTCRIAVCLRPRSGRCATGAR